MPPRPLVQPPLLRLRDVQVDGRGRGAGVAQQVLDYTDVGPAVQDVSGEGAAQRVRVNKPPQDLASIIGYCSPSFSGDTTDATRFS